MRLANILARDERGVAATEMALALPVMVTMIYGIFQVGLLYQANAGMQHALGEGARFATLCVPTDHDLQSSPRCGDQDSHDSKLFGRGDRHLHRRRPGRRQPATGTSRSRYTKKMNFIFFPGPTITLNRTKRGPTPPC